MKHSIVVGIDLGTTNSAVAIARGDRIDIVPIDMDPLLPSVVGFDGEDGLVLGHVARNQALLQPERTVRSIKRRMGEDTTLELGRERLTPVEISALLLRRLKLAAEDFVQGPVNRAVITVPAYFDDAQRTATREAGEVAGFEVERILNEPTAAALCYLGDTEASDRLFLVYDLGGGTFDVSVVRARGKITEVLASHGDTRLGGDDFDHALYELLRQRFIAAGGPDPEANPRARARLYRAAEDAKIRLSSRESTPVIEEHLMTVDGVGHHLDTEVSRATYEGLIEPWVERTRDSVQVALREARVLVADLDDVLLVGGATRTPLVRRTLQQLLNIEPRDDVDPDKAVAMGAAIQAARIGGDLAQRILVDVTPFSFGTSFFGLLHGEMSPHCCKSIIPRSSALPARKHSMFATMVNGQRRTEVSIHQGEDPDARENTLLGRFEIDDLDPTAPAGSELRFELALDLNGILNVEVTEVHTGKKKSVTIHDALRRLSDDELIDARRRVLDLFGEDGRDWAFRHVNATTVAASAGDDDDDDDDDDMDVPATLQPPTDLTTAERKVWQDALNLLETARGVRDSDKITVADATELDDLTDQLRQALADADLKALGELSSVLTDVLFYLE